LNYVYQRGSGSEWEWTGGNRSIIERQISDEERIDAIAVYVDNDENVALIPTGFTTSPNYFWKREINLEITHPVPKLV